MQMQLHAQSNGAFDRFKDEYLMAIAKRRTSILLRFADGFTGTKSPEKLIYVLKMYEVLGSTVPGLMLVFTGQHKELVSRQVEAVLTKLAQALRIMISGLVTKIWSSQSTTVSIGAGVHPLTRYTMACINSLAPHRGALDLVLASTGGGTEGLSSFDNLVTELIVSLEPKLDAVPGPSLAAHGRLRRGFLGTSGGFPRGHTRRQAHCEDPGQVQLHTRESVQQPRTVQSPRPRAPGGATEGCVG